MQSTEPETWKPVVGYEGYYEVSDHGRVRSHDRIVSARPAKTGYPVVFLTVDRARRTALVHHLVLEAFVGPRPEGMYGCHNDGNRRNNARSNLRWDTPASNTQDMLDHGHHYLVNRTHCPREHLLEAPNLVPSKLRSGHRQCLACARAQSITHQAGRPFSAVLADEKYRAIMA